MNEIEKIVAGRWIAGDKIEDAIIEARKLNKDNIRVIINYLGELHMNRSDIDRDVKICLALVREIRKSGVKADISVKPTQIGLDLTKREFLKNLKLIMHAAAKARVFVWLDMEERQFVSDTIDAYLRTFNGGSGICIQSYLKRSLGNVKLLLSRKAVIRLVKGAYRPKGPDFYSEGNVMRNYMHLMESLFRNGHTFTIASHDQRIINRALRLNKRYKRRVTYAMLEGIRSSYALSLVERGELVSTYVPFGPEWMAYSIRRMKELGNLKLVLRSLLGG